MKAAVRMDRLKKSGVIFISATLIAVWTSVAEGGFTNRPFPGITFHSEALVVPPTRLYVAEIDLTDPKIHLRVSPGGPDPDGLGEWQTTLLPPTRIAEREGFDLVVNGDFFRVAGPTNLPATNRYRAGVWSAVVGPAESSGSTWSTSPSERPCLVVQKSGKVVIRSLSSPGTNDQEVISGNLMLVQNGEIVPHENTARHPRTAVGLDAAGQKLTLLIVDGRKPGIAAGMSYDELAQELRRLGCWQALNLDGGGSSILAVRDPATRTFNILNQPTDGRERPVANVLGITVAP